MLGETISHYRITSKLGKGGMGDVYLAEDVRLGREVALKFLAPELVRDRESLARFRNEAKTAAELSHPNIATIHEFDEVEGKPFLVLEYLRGQTLQQRVARGPLPIDDVLRIGCALASGLAEAHAHGVVHRDIKSANVMLTEKGEVKILDFGLSHRDDATQLTRPGTTLGTIGYMSPEQTRGETADERSDIWGVGVVLYECLTGRLPFVGEQASVLEQIRAADVTPPTGLRTGVSLAAERVVLRCLEKDPQLRYQHADDLKADMLILQRDAASAPRRERTPKGRLWLWAAGSLLGGALLAVGLLRALAPTTGGPEPTTPRIVVLPFENLGSAEDEFFADGITEELTSRLALASGLRVLSRTTATQYKANRPSLAQIGRELDIDYALEGTVRWARSPDGSSRVRVTPQLIRASDDSHLWTRTYDRVLDDIFTIQSELAVDVLRELEIVLSEAELTLMDTSPTQNLEAYQAYLRGRHFSTRPHFTSSDMTEAMASYQRAVELDPGFALAWAEISKVHSEIVYYRADPSGEHERLAREALDRAAESAADSPEVRLALGYYYLANRDTERADEQLDLAARDLPNSADLFMIRGELMRMRGRMDDAVANYSRAADLSPRDASPVLEVGITRWAQRRHREADEAHNHAIALEPDQTWPYLMKAWNIWSWKGAVPEARRTLRAADSNHPWTPYMWFWQEVYEGNYEAALAWLDRNPGDWVRLKMWVRPEALLRAYVHQLRNEPLRAQAEFEEAAAMLEAEVGTHPDEARAHSALGLAYAALGRKEEAIRHGIQATELFPHSRDAAYGLPHAYDLVRIYAGVGEYDEAFDELEPLMSTPGWITIPILEMDPRFAPLLEQSRFQELVSKVGT